MLRNMLGGVGDLLTFLDLAKMVGATQHVGWGEGGRVMLTFLELIKMVDATQHVGWVGVMLTFLELAKMVGATQHVG